MSARSIVQRGTKTWHDSDRHVRRAAASAALALVVALAWAVVPAHVQRTSVRWPVAPPPAAELARPTAGSALLLARHVPARLSVTFPCADAPVEAGFLFETARSPSEAGALTVTTVDGALHVDIGSVTLATVQGWA